VGHRSLYQLRTYQRFTSGEVVEGLDIVKNIESYGSSSGKTAAVIAIAESGVVDMDGAAGAGYYDHGDGALPPNVFVRRAVFSFHHSYLTTVPVQTFISSILPSGTTTLDALFSSSTMMSSQKLPVISGNSQQASTGSDTKDPGSIA
jgi:hypothetical protein